MRRRLPFPTALVALVLLVPAATATAATAPKDDVPTTPTTPATPPPTTPTPPPEAPPTAAATVPNGKPTSVEGQEGRVAVNGPWLFRPDSNDVGVKQRFFAQRGISGWGTVSVPSAWNAGDDSSASFTGSIGWYRKDFRLPARSTATAWTIRFESVNFEATIWLNGRKLTTHMGGYVPFEVQLPNVNRRGVNRLVVRVDNRRNLREQTGSRTDHPVPPAGWWNYGGILRTVYLRPIERVDLTNVAVTPRLPNPHGAATIDVSTDVRNASSQTQSVHLTGRYGTQAFDLGTRSIPAGQTITVTGSLKVAHPRVWSPASPHLYRVRLAGTAQQRGDRRPIQAAAYDLDSGIRSITVKNGQLMLDGSVVHFRGVAILEDTQRDGPVLTEADRKHLLSLAKGTGATLIRSQYPLDPEFQDLADRDGVLLMTEIPATYQLPEALLGRKQYIDLADQELTANVTENRNHASVALWSLGNEMPSTVGPNQSAYIAQGYRLVKSLDPSRPVGMIFAGHPEAGCQAGYGPLDWLGMNDYFGWYTGVGGNIADRDLLSSYLDSVRQCYPKKAIAVTEYGAEANRAGPVDEKGTYDFQNAFIQSNIATFDSKSWLAGSVYFALQEFRVTPGWDGGNPWATPPFHTTGLIRLNWSRKPAYDVLAGLSKSFRQFVTPR